MDQPTIELKPLYSSKCFKEDIIITVTDIVIDPSTSQLGGTNWTVQLGRRDSTTANLSAANNDLPSPALNLSDLITAFSNKGLTANELVALSGEYF